MPDQRLHCPQCLGVFRQALRRCPSDGALLASYEQDPLVGQVVGNGYLVEAVIGDGGMGRVYLAGPDGKDTDRDHNGERYAIKVLYAELAADPRHYERFVREAARASSFDHPNLVKVLDFGSTAGGQPYVAMVFVRGVPLAALIREQAPFEKPRVVSLTSDLCRALDHIHRRGVVHRDVKTGNVLVTRAARRETALLFDFGVAIDVRSGESRLTTRQTAIGTLSYMSPERALCQTFDHRADLFSLGVVLYQMLSGRRPFDGTPMMVAIQNMTVAAPPIAERAPGVTVNRGLEAIAHKLMARDPAERYQSAGEVLRALENI